MTNDVIVDLKEAQNLTDHELTLAELLYESDGGKVCLHTSIIDGMRVVSNGMHFSGVRLDEFSSFQEA